MVDKVIQWGAGSIDPIAIRHFAENPTYEGTLINEYTRRVID
jgi:hypothetical protein